MKTARRMRTVVEMWKAAVAQHPGRTAVVDGASSLTYCELNSRVRKWESRLRAVRTETAFVALHLPHRAESIAALLGILAAGRAFVAIDPATPVTHRCALLDYAQARVVIGMGSHADELRDAGWDGEFITATGADAVSPQEMEDGACDLQSRAALCFTSGSSGNPKGVVTPHRTFAFAAQNLHAMFEFRPEDRHALLAPLAVASTHAQVFAPLAAGATICMLEARLHSLSRLAAWLQEEGVTTVQTVPSLARALFSEAASGAGWPAMRALKTGGESTTIADVQLFESVLPEGATLINGLGITEAGCNVCWFRRQNGSKLGGQLMPIGVPPDDIEIVIENAEGAIAACGEPGQIVVRSPMLPTSYWRDPAKTAAVYRDLPEREGWRELRTGDTGRWRDDGQLEHLGRLDQTVNVRGHRVCLVEVEAALNDTGLLSGAVAFTEDSGSGTRLCAAVTFRPGAETDDSILRSRLAQKLPGYMVPAVLQIVERLPRLENGKIDRSQFASGNQSAAVELPAPRDALEQTLHGLFSRALQKKPLALEASFFDEGGDSLVAAALFASIKRVFDRDLPLTDLVAHPSVKSLAEHMRSTGTQAHPAITLLTPYPEENAQNIFVWPGAGSDTLALYPLARNLGASHAMYGVQHRGADGTRQYDLTVEDAASRGVQLVRRVQPQGPYALCGTSYGGLIALEVARKLQVQGETVNFLAMLDSYSPGYPRRRADLGLRDRLALWSRKFRPFSQRDKPGLAVLRKGLHEQWQRFVARRFVQRPDPDTEPLPIPIRFLYLQEACFIASRAYRPADYHGEVHFYTVAEPTNTRFFERDAAHGWSQYLKGALHIETIPGRHSQHIKEPHVAALAEKLRNRLNELRE